MKLIFKACKEIIKIFFIIFFLYIKMTNNYYQKHSEKKHVENIKIFLKKKKTKVRKRLEKDFKILLKKKKKKSVIISVNLIKTF